VAPLAVPISGRQEQSSERFRTVSIVRVYSLCRLRVWSNTVAQRSCEYLDLANDFIDDNQLGTCDAPDV
jgi:hypothetical protein